MTNEEKIEQMNIFEEDLNDTITFWENLYGCFIIAQVVVL